MTTKKKDISELRSKMSQEAQERASNKTKEMSESLASAKAAEYSDLTAAASTESQLRQAKLDKEKEVMLFLEDVRTKLYECQQEARKGITLGKTKWGGSVFIPTFSMINQALVEVINMVDRYPRK